ncbi:MarR family winged helix-turn-helix transcriptional regulator [Fodinibius sp. SL11]|uniref:MarR family winged helix-turn-helix transcriptional regulator n=1 Tax=Fodinibius sp. SL11 TaxID=3425690 RepID=UPI003F884339
MSLHQKLYCETTGCRMAYVVKEMVRSLKSRFQEEDIDLTIEQFFILNILDNEDGLILQELAEIVDRDKSAVLRHIDGLEQHHFVTRVQDESDKRRKILLITKPGLKVLEKARAVDQQLDREINAEIQNIETKEFEDALANMYNFLSD